MKLRWMLLALGLSQAIAGAVTAAAPTTAWVQMTADGAQVRAVVTGRCPDLEVDGRSAPMRQRAGSEDGFPNHICQADLPADARRAAVAGIALPIPKARPQRLVILGDTGCRLKGVVIQDCNDPIGGWPFAKVSALAAAQKPDLVIHVGDYYYRETRCPPLIAGCDGSPHGVKWPTWKADLFDPAAPLIAAAPWVFARGNHEDCERGGAGWFRLLDADHKARTCPGESATFMVPLDGLRLAILDTSDADDADVSRQQVSALAKRLQAIPKGGDPVWLITHKPIWSSRRDGQNVRDGGTNANLRTVAREQGLGQIELVVAGHLHNFTSLDFGPTRPGQLIVGTGGDRLDRGNPPPPAVGEVEIDGKSAQAFTMGRFGYFILERVAKPQGRRGAEPDDWNGTFRDLNDAVIARCAVRGGRLSCASA